MVGLHSESIHPMQPRTLAVHWCKKPQARVGGCLAGIGFNTLPSDTQATIRSEVQITPSRRCSGLSSAMIHNLQLNPRKEHAPRQVSSSY